MVTYTINRDPDYHDLDLSFTKDRRTKDVVAIEGVAAIVKSIENLVNLNFYEKPFQPSIGSNVRKLLFENITQMTSIFIQNAIAEVIQNFEPRAKLLGVDVIPATEKNGYGVNIIFSMLNSEQTIQIDMFLNRVR